MASLLALTMAVNREKSSDMVMFGSVSKTLNKSRLAKKLQKKKRDIYNPSSATGMTGSCHTTT